MASIKIAYMPQDSSSLITPYLPESSLRGKGKGGFWATPTTSVTAPAGNTPSSSSVWGPPLSVLNNNNAAAASVANSSGPGSMPASLLQPVHQSLAALAANSEPVTSDNAIPTSSTRSSPSFAQPTLGHTGSRLSSRQNSHSDTPSPVLAASSVSGSPTGSTVPNTPQSKGLPPVSAHLSGASGGTVSLNDEIINTAIVVKNIPFAIKKEQLIDFMTQLGLPLPYAFNYHFDNGVFRGLAFANFATAEETATVIASLNGRELGGRKLRVEYKKMLPYQERERIEREKRERRGQLEEQHQKIETSQAFSQGAIVSPLASHQHSQPQARASNGNSVGGSISGSLGSLSHVEPVATLASRTPSRGTSSVLNNPIFSGMGLNQSAVDMNDPEVLETYSSLLIFKRDPSRRELVIPPQPVSQMLANQANVLNALCEKLDLICGINDDQAIVIAKRGDRPYPEEGETYLTGLLRHAVSPVSLLRAKNHPVASLQAASLGHKAPAAVHHPSFPNITATTPSASAAHTNGLQRWNSVGTGAPGANAGGNFTK